MKKMKFLLIFVVIVAIAFTCKKQHNESHADHDHAAGETHADHDHAAGETHADHDHAAGETHADHDHAAGETHADHDHAAGETHADHDHAAGETHADHDHAAGETHADHDHAAGETHADHDHAAGETHADHDHAAEATPADHDHDAEDPGHPVAVDAAHSHDDEGIIAIDSNWENLVGLKTADVEKRQIEELISVPGRIIPNADKIAILNPLIESSVNCVMAKIGDRVHKGDELICLISPRIGSLRAEYDKAKAELRINDKNYKRRKKLYEEKIISERAFQETERDKQLADVNLEYARKQLLAVGVAVDELDNPPDKHGNMAGSTLHIHAPIAGVITKRNAVIGQKVGSDDRLFEIIDLSEVWCEADIFEKDLKNVRIGQKVKLRVSSLPDERYYGKIFFVGSTLDAITKTIKILVLIKNPGEKLKPGMFSDTYIVSGEKAGALVIPRTAIMEDENLKVVFVKEAGGYHRHVISTGIVSDQFIEVLSGLTENDVVVTTGAYQLKSKSKMSTVDPHAGHVH